MIVNRRENVLAVSNDAVRTVREAAQMATFVGLNPDSVGSLLHTYDPGGPEELKVPASYLKFNVRSPERVLFQSTTLKIDQVKGVTPSNIWAVVGDDNFSRIYIGKYSFTKSDGNLLEWEWNDLEIDSIDAIDLMDRLRRQTGRKIVSERFRSVRTVSDLVDTIHQLVNET